MTSVLVFPRLPGWGFSVHKIPTFQTMSSVHVSGKEAMAVCQAYPLWEFTLTFEVLRDQTMNANIDSSMSPFVELQQIMGLFLACQGQAGRFLFDDPTDDSRSDSVIGTGTGSQVVFTVTRSLGTYTEPVGGLTQVSAVYISGIEQSPESYGWNFGSPLITFNSPPGPGDIVSADFTFAYYCRFSEDQQDYEEFLNNLWRLQTCKFRSTKL